jgi:protease-4
MNQKTKRGLIIFLTGMALLTSGCVTVNLFPPNKGLEEKDLLPSSARDKILFLSLDGFIGDQGKKGGIPLFGGRKNQVRLVRKELQKASGDEHIRAIVFMIDSPGGTVTASDRIYHLIRLYRKKTHIPVIAFFGDLGASGAYYVAMGSDEVWARPTSVVGSIGVMIANVGVEGLMKKVGVTDRTVASGPEKEMGSPLKEMTPEDRTIFEGLVQDFYGSFLGVVSKNRKIDQGQLARLADGRVYSASQALRNHLIDRVGYRDDLVGHLKRKLGIPHVRLVQYRMPDQGSPPFLGMTSPGIDTLSVASVISILKSMGPTPLYLWEPGGLSMK